MKTVHVTLSEDMARLAAERLEAHVNLCEDIVTSMRERGGPTGAIDGAEAEMRTARLAAEVLRYALRLT